MICFRHIRLLPILILFSSGVSAQSGKLVRLGFTPLYDGVPLQLGHNYISGGHGDSLIFATFKIYLSRFRFYKKGKLVHEAEKSFFLIDVTDAESLDRQVLLPDDISYDEIRFYFGIDDKTNNEGTGSGDLDPSRGMYWAWQTGYINMKLEGHTGGKEFQFHLGGFLKPHVSFQEISLKSSTEAIIIGIDVARFIKSFTIDETSMIMSPSAKAVQLSQKAAQMFFLL